MVVNPLLVCETWYRANWIQKIYFCHEVEAAISFCQRDFYTSFYYECKTLTAAEIAPNNTTVIQRCFRWIDYIVEYRVCTIMSKRNLLNRWLFYFLYNTFVNGADCRLFINVNRDIKKTAHKQTQKKRHTINGNHFLSDDHLLTSQDNLYSHLKLPQLRYASWIAWW